MDEFEDNELEELAEPSKLAEQRREVIKPIEKIHLDNGLQIMLKEIHTAPIISHWVWYRVGSRDEDFDQVVFFSTICAKINQCVQII